MLDISSKFKNLLYISIKVSNKLIINIGLISILNYSSAALNSKTLNN
jgi:hypothetical protein